MALLSNIILKKSNYNQAITLIVNSRLAMIKLADFSNPYIGRLSSPLPTAAFWVLKKSGGKCNSNLTFSIFWKKIDNKKFSTG